VDRQQTIKPIEHGWGKYSTIIIDQNGHQGSACHWSLFLLTSLEGSDFQNFYF